MDKNGWTDPSSQAGDKDNNNKLGSAGCFMLMLLY